MTSLFTQKIISLLLLISFLIAPVTTYASNTTDYQPQTKQELLAYLMGVLAQLQAQLAAQKNEANTTTNSNTKRIQPNPHSTYVVAHAPYSIDRATVTFRGEVDSGSSATYEVWFEYGAGSNLNKRSDVVSNAKTTSNTRTTRTTRAKKSTILIPETDLTPGVRYNYRMVIEDEDGYRQYSQMLSFNTIGKAGVQSFTGKPVIETEGADIVTNSGATLGGFVSMNNYLNGLVFLVHSTNRSEVEDLVDDYDSYEEIVSNKAGMVKTTIKKDFSGRDKQTIKVGSLKAATKYYYRACVQYKASGTKLICGNVESFVTQN